MTSPYPQLAGLTASSIPFMGDVEDAASPTELAGVVDVGTEAVEAWSLELPEVEVERRGPRLITAGAVAASLALAVGVGVWGWQYSRPHVVSVPSSTVTAVPSAPAVVSPPSSAAVARPDVSAARIVPPPPPPVTVTAAAPIAPPPAGIPVYVVAAYDRQFVANMQARDWAVRDPVLLTQRAHLVCGWLQSGISPRLIGERLVAQDGLPPSAAAQFVTTAMLTYPDCP